MERRHASAVARTNSLQVLSPIRASESEDEISSAEENDVNAKLRFLDLAVHARKKSMFIIRGPDDDAGPAATGAPLQASGDAPDPDVSGAKSSTSKQSIVKKAATQENVKYFEIWYPGEPAKRKCFTEFPLKLSSVDNETLQSFLSNNNIDFMEDDTRELVYYRIQAFLTELWYANMKSSTISAMPITQFTREIEEDLLENTSAEILSDEEKFTEDFDLNEMISQLPVESATMLTELSQKSKAEVQQTVTCFGGEVDGAMSKQLMLEVLFALLSENARAENGLMVIREKVPKRERVVEVPECCICMEDLVSIYIHPCGHAVVCADCSKNITSCPMCRKTITKTTAIFF